MKRQQFRGQHGQQGLEFAVLLDPARATGFVNAVLASMRVDQSLDNSQVLELTRRLAQLNPSQVTFRTVPVTGERSMGAIGNVVTWDGPDLRTCSLHCATTPRSRTSLLPRASRWVLGISGFNCWGPATWPRTRLRISTPLATTWSAPVAGTLTATTIEYDPGYNVSLKTLKAAPPDAQTVAVPGLGSTFRVTIGADYAGVTQVSVKDPTAPDAPALRPATSAARTLGKPRPARRVSDVVRKARAHHTPVIALASTVFTNGPLWARRHRDAVRPK